MNIVILGATGSIGSNTLAVLEKYPHPYQLIAVTAYRQVPRMLEICEQFKPKYAVMVDEKAARTLKECMTSRRLSTKVLSGVEFLSTMVDLPEVNTVVAGIVGTAGLIPTYRAVSSGKKVLLANKEVLVMAGELVMATAKRTGAQIIPIDSEHSAIFQCLSEHPRLPFISKHVEKITLTASGGPFLSTPIAELANVSHEQACSHPNWVMGKKISIDSATLINKGLEVIEAHHLFNMPFHSIDVVIHPQSIVHAFVEYSDGAVLSQLSQPDMRIPIAYGLSHPHRITFASKKLALQDIQNLEFFPVDDAKFPGFKSTLQAGKAGGSMPIVLNAANEIAVNAFLKEQISFTQISAVIKKILNTHMKEQIYSLAQVIDIDTQARYSTQKYIEELIQKADMTTASPLEEK